ncbi:MAG: FtsX-like permease family protein [Thermoplasmata archaeon]|nr:FtsX-like permease family protein [Thermoplasmata archaeon]MCI4359707.1 FtsX-like permease family protein [Thermoplasmata archaeon]
MIDPLLVFTLILLGAVGLISAGLAARNRLPLRIALRNIRRARSRSVLVVLGLLVGTAIISGSLAVGDTVSAVNLHYTKLGLGYTDEGVFGLGPTGSYQYFPQSVAGQLINASSTDPQIAGLTPEIVDTVQVFDRSTQIPQTNLNLVGTDPSASRVLGSFTSTSGASVMGPSPGMVLLDQFAANQLDAKAGDAITLYGSVPVPSTVQAVVQDDLRGGFLTAGLSGGAAFVDLSTAQLVENVSGQVNFIAVANVGSQSSGVGLSSSVSAHLNTTLSGIPGANRLGAHPLLQSQLADATAAGSGIVTIFLVFGLFSIIAGAMLIVGIFTMIAEERKGEMGMLRAIGLGRRDVVLSYYLEGLIYSAGSALAGVVVGVATGYILLYAYVQLVGSQSPGTPAVLTSFTVNDSSLLASYLAGFLLTLGTVVIASIRVSRLNIVRAIRDVPEPPPAIRTYTYLAYVGGLVLVLGALLFATTYRGTGDISEPMIAGGMILLGGALVGSRFLKNRAVFTAVGVGLVVWAGYQALQTAVLGTAHSGGIFVVFIQGIELIGGAILLFAFNAAQLAAVVERATTGRLATAPVARMGLAYPSRRVGRTAITTTIFALVLFVIVVLATYSATLTGNLSDSIGDESGGYTFFGYSAQPIRDLPGAIASNSTLAPLYANVVPLIFGLGELAIPGFPLNNYHDNVYAAASGAPVASNFYDTNAFPFQATLHGVTAAATMAQLSSNQSVAIVDGSYGGAGFSTSGHPLVSVGTVVNVVNPGTGASTNVTVIGIMKQLVLGGIWLNPTAAQSMGFNSTSGYLLKVHSGVSPTTASQATKAAFYKVGLVLVDFTAILATTIAIISGQIGLLEVFIGLGLAVGIAALGIVALRAVTERRRETGMLRATGLTKGMILKMFLIEYSFITLIGALIGGTTGLLLVYNLVLSPGASAADVTKLYIPWLNLLIVMLVTGCLATLAVISPSWRASRLPPAEAVRGIE